jgi:hypothetical protein
MEHHEVVDPWLCGFSQAAHGTIEGLFNHPISQGATDPDQIIAHVEEYLKAKLDWCVQPASRAICFDVLRDLRSDRAAVARYVASQLRKVGAVAREK